MADPQPRRRFFLEIAYKGSTWHGWQVQPGQATVQGKVEEGLSTILNREVSTIGSGRTDAGVHAAQQFASFDAFESELAEPQKFAHSLNSLLPPSIVILGIYEVQPEANPRFRAFRREYQYVLRYIHSPFEHGLYAHVHTPLDVAMMNEVAKGLLGKQDFQSFSRTHSDVTHYVCEVFHAHWTEEPDGLRFHIAANRFLRGMVRAIVGTLLEMGRGQRPADQLPEILAARNREAAGKAAPAQGLFLTQVLYPKEIFLGEPPHWD